jgi:SAM-dependent methyltransferase
MHPSARDLGRLLFENYWRSGFRRVLDIGSLDVNGSLREFTPPGAEYIGIDLESGKGVDLVLDDPYTYPFEDNWFNLIVSTSCFENDPMFWLTFLEVGRVLAPGGALYINAPSSGSYHTHPWDNWRFYPDASHALEMWAARSGAALHVVESFCVTGRDHWNDYVMIFTKGTPDPAQHLISDQLTGLQNIRQARRPGAILQRDHNSPDMRAIFELQRELALARKEIATLRAENSTLRQASARTRAGAPG